MSFNRQGLDWIAERLQADLEGATLVVGNGQAPESDGTTELAGEFTAEAPVTEVELVGWTEGRYRVILRATFGEQAANFEWAERGVKLSDGRLVDRAVADQGRKAAGSVWTLEATLDLVP